MRSATPITLVMASLLAAPAGAVAQESADDARVTREAAALPERLWAPGAEPVSAAGPGLSEDDVGAIAPLLAGLLLLGAAGMGYGVSLLQPARSRVTAAPVPEPEPAPEPERAPQAVAPTPLPVVHEAASESETCVIALSHAWGRGQFEVRVKDKRGAYRVVASSLAFAVPRGMVIEQTGAAGRAHRRLLLHLVAAGWRIDPPADGPWYERRLSRPVGEPDRRDVDRALVAPQPEGGEAEFVALALDEYGNAHVMARSPRFGRRAGRPVEETEAAVAAHGTLLQDLEARGWHVSETLESWYGTALARRRD
jgi:hypothetical protein